MVKVLKTVLAMNLGCRWRHNGIDTESKGTHRFGLLLGASMQDRTGQDRLFLLAFRSP